MTYRQLYKITDTKLVITLPSAFKDKQVLVTIDDKVTQKAPMAIGGETDKIALMKLAAKDPLYLADMKEVNDDFEGIEHETL